MKKVLLILLVLIVSLQANTIYVNHKTQTRQADGQSWSTAYKNLNKALNLAKSGDDVWLAKGEYILKPTRLKGVNIYGGFSSTETELSQRDIVNNETKIFGRLALQNALLSSVTILQEPENHRVVEIDLTQTKKRTHFVPNRQKMQEERARREREERRTQQEQNKRESQSAEVFKENKDLESQQDVSSQTWRSQSDVSSSNRPRGPQGDRRGPPHPKEILQKFDTNSDGKISKEEAPYRMKGDWNRLDKNKDGFVEEHEITPPQGKGGERPHRQERR